LVEAKFAIWVCFGTRLKNHKCTKITIELSEEIQLKSLRIALIISIIVAAFLSIGFVAALAQDEASVHTFFSTTTLQPGKPVDINVSFTSNSSDSLQITRIGLHFDWLATGVFYTDDLSSNPVTVVSDGTHMFSQINIMIPTNVTLGEHSYYVAIDGKQGTSSTAFFWDSPASTVVVASSSGQTTGPTVTVAPTGGGNQGGQPDLQLYGAVGAVVVIVVLLVIVLLLRGRKPKLQTAKEPVTSQPETSESEQKPEQKPEEQDFDI
jgi:hypothetical protein